MSQSFVYKIANMVLLGVLFLSVGAQGREQIDVTKERLQQDESILKTYVTQTIAADIKRAKEAGKTAAHIGGGISNYAYDSIPWMFFDDQKAIDEVFSRMFDEAAVKYIQDGKEEYKKTISRMKPRMSKSKLAEFLHRRAIDAMNISDEDKKVLNDDPVKTDDFVRQGTVSKDDYMYYNLLNLAIQYYVEKEFGRR